MRILFLSAWFPYPPDNGSKIRIYNLVRALGKRHQVALLSFGDATDQTTQASETDSCSVVGVVPRNDFHPNRIRALLGFLSPVPRSLVDTFSPEMAGVVRQQLDRSSYDVLIASQLSTAVYLPRSVRTPKIFEEVENSVIRDAYARASSRVSRFRNRLTWVKTRRHIRRVVRQFDVCTVVSELERTLLHEVAPNYNRVEVIPNGVDLEWLHSNGAKPEPETLVFNGALTYSANYDAMRYFLADVWPRVKAIEPVVSLKITGRTDGVGLDLSSGDGVRFTGYLPDVRPTVAGAWACVVPIRIGGGTRVKILEAMALGTPVIATSKGAEGLDVMHGENILIADNPAQFASETVRLLRDPTLRARLAANARRLVEEKYNWRSIGDRFSSLVESVASRRGVEAC